LRALYFEGEFAFTWSQLMTIFHLENVQIFEFQFVQFIHKTLAKEEVHHKVIHHLWCHGFHNLDRYTTHTITSIVEKWLWGFLQIKKALLKALEYASFQWIGYRHSQKIAKIAYFDGYNSLCNVLSNVVMKKKLYTKPTKVVKVWEEVKLLWDPGKKLVSHI
jgi:hypothetical protein